MLKKTDSLAFLILSSFLLLTACVSKKKHLAAITELTTNHQTEVEQWQSQVSTSEEKINGLELLLAERKGENNILVDLRQELLSKISDLETNIENMGAQSQNKQQNLSATLQQKEQKIAALQAQLARVGETLRKNEAVFNVLSSELSTAFQEYPEDQYSILTRYDRVSFSLPESVLFRRKSTTRMEEDGLVMLEELSKILARYPSFSVYVTGHTDNTPPREVKRYTDNWNFSALQAATVVRTLIDEFDLSTGQLIISAKGGFSPRASNATKEGKAQNRRIEFVIMPQVADLAKEVQRVLEE